ncbi:unnamed protein product [Effrenium voratum]|uniref:SET domain-containing protein n=1 Tax=Effrenium voratum TaxID=2562239 RepID=A0AA36NCR0_9DINO|nr:unnamed protein product [Effrenium voratum]
MHNGPDVDWERVWQGDFSQLRGFVHESLEVRCLDRDGDRGVVSAAPLAAGELLLAERCLDPPNVAPEKALGQRLHDAQPHMEALDWQRLDFMCDDDDLKQFPKPIPLPSWPANLRRSEGRTITLRQMQRKVALNAYRCSAPVSEYAFSMDQIREEERHENFGVFPLASLFNHSCAPNMAKVLLADWVFLRAGRDVAPGEELTQYYCDIRMPVEMRRKELSDLFGFTCGCPRCLFELKMQKDQTAEPLEPWRRLYSSEVPSFHPRYGALQVSQLEGIVAEAEAAALAAAPDGPKDWAVWPLVPALQQLATRLRLDGRQEESLEVFQRAEAVARSVVPLSNIHLRLHSELLLTGRSDELYLESRCLVAQAFGPGEAVWRLLVGFNLGEGAELEAKPCAIFYQWEEQKGKTLKVWSAAFQRLEDIQLDASAEVLLFRAPGALDLQDAFSYSHLLERLEGERKDFHPLNPRERGVAADMCRYIDQQLQAQGFASLSSALEAEVLRADHLLEQLQQYLPKPLRPEDARVAENLLRLGRPMSGGCVDAAEFCQRFEVLARSGAAAGSAALVPVPPPPLPDSDVTKLVLREKPCPVDIDALGLTRLAQVAQRLEREFPDGTCALFRLVRVLEAEMKTLPSARQQDQLKKWLEPAPGDQLHWPMLLGFQVTIEKLTVMATKELRKSYSQFQMGVSFCGRDLKSRRVSWRMGYMCLSKPNIMEMQPKWMIIFTLDGPDGLSARDVSLALSETPEPPPSHRLRFSIFGIKTGEEEARELGSCELCAGYDLPSADLRPKDAKAQRVIECSAHQADLGATALSPALRATLVLSTRRAGRLREVAGRR